MLLTHRHQQHSGTRPPQASGHYSGDGRQWFDTANATVAARQPSAAPVLTGRTVADVMASTPRTLPPTTTVADARAFFEDDHVHMALIAASGVLLGTLVRADLVGSEVGASVPALSRSLLDGRLVGGDERAEEVRMRMIDRGQRRLAVVDGSGLLVGLLCLKRKLTGFCSDADIAARAAGHAIGHLHTR